MSNYANVTLEGLKNAKLDILQKAAEKLGYDLIIGDTHMRTRYGEGDDICARLAKKDGDAMEIGFKRVTLENNEYELKLVGEFWHTGLNAKEFMGDIRREYRVIDIKETLENYGYYFDVETVDENNNVVLECFA